MANHPNRSKYIISLGGDEYRAATAAQVDDMIRYQNQWGNQREREITARRVLARGDTLSDSVATIRLRNLPD